MVFTYIRSHEWKAFLPIVGAVIFCAHIIAYNVWDLPYRTEDVLFETQINKLTTTTTPIETVIVGDSAAGYALNAQLFSTLSGSPTMNIALTRSHGFIGSLNMLKQAKLRHPEIRKVILVHSHDIWTLPFSREGFFKTEKGIDSQDVSSQYFPTYKWLDRIAYRSDFKWLYRYARYVVKGSPPSVFIRDYIEHPGEKGTYRNGQLPLPQEGLSMQEIDSNQQKAFFLIDTYCKNEQLHCVFVGAPLHELTMRYTNPAYFEHIFNVLDRAVAIQPLRTLFAVPNEYMGDAVTHLDSFYKDEMTRAYYEALREEI